MLAAAAIAANPDKSDRVIADEIGVNQSTVSRARKQPSGDAFASPDRHTGKDGKSYSAKRKRQLKPQRNGDIEYSQDFGRRAHKFLQVMTDEFYRWLETNPTLPSEALRSLIGMMNVCGAQYQALAEAAADQMEEEQS